MLTLFRSRYDGIDWYDIDKDGLPGANWGNRCSPDGSSQTEGSFTLLTCPSGICSSADRDPDDTCKCNDGSNKCYDACGICNGNATLDYNGNGTNYPANLNE